MSTKTFYETAEKFRNDEIWILDPNDGTKKIKDFLIPEFNWNKE